MNRESQTTAGLTKAKLTTSWMLQLIAAAILAQTLFFKFTGAEESKFIFSTLGAEPWGRIATGCAELVAVLLLLAPRTVALGALLSLGLMTGAIASHFAKLGLVVKGDGGLLFGLAVTAFVCSAAILVLRRRQIPVIGSALAACHETNCTTGVCHH